MAQSNADPVTRFWQRVDKTESCWIWTGPPNVKSGYGYTNVDRQRTLAHRFAYELLVGPIPDGLHIDHLCRVRLCVNPAHLEAVTQAENNRRAFVANKQPTCRHGHLNIPENRCSNGPGRTMCRLCNREKVRCANLAKKQSAA